MLTQQLGVREKGEMCANGPRTCHGSADMLHMQQVAQICPNNHKMIEVLRSIQN